MTLLFGIQNGRSKPIVDVILDRESASEPDEDAGTMNEMEPIQKVEYGVTKEHGAPKDVPLELPEDDASGSPIFSEEDKDEDDLILFDLQQPIDSDREGR